MEKSMRCTVCTWRGSWDAAEAARPARRSNVPAAVEQVQEAYDETQRAKEEVLGIRREPPCPVCGHHLVAVPRSSTRPAM